MAPAVNYTATLLKDCYGGLMRRVEVSLTMSLPCENCGVSGPYPCTDCMNTGYASGERPSVVALFPLPPSAIDALRDHPRIARRIRASLTEGSLMVNVR